MTKTKRTLSDAIAMMFPGRVVPIPGVVDPEEGPKLVVTVYPLGIRHFKEFRGAIGSIIGSLGNIQIDKLTKGTDDEKDIAIGNLIVAALPTIFDEGMELLEACVVIKPDGIELGDLPQNALPPIAEAWIEETFCGDGILPWKLAMKRLMGNSDRPFSISEILSKLSSPADTPDPTSSTGGK